MHDVFISYSAKETAAAKNVRRILEKNQILCWMAPDNIPSGSNYAKEIPVAISECSVFFLMLSQNSQESQWVRRELDTAVNCGKLIIPFEMEACQLNDEFKFLLNGVQRCAAYQKKAEVMGDLVKQIYAVTGRVLPVAEPEEEMTDLSEKQLEVKETEQTEDAQKKVRCPACGNDQLALRDMGMRLGLGATACVVGGILMGPVVGPLVAGPAVGLAVGRCVGATHFRCVSCGKEFEYTSKNEKPSDEESEEEACET